MRRRLTLWFVFGVVLIAVFGAATMYAILSHQRHDDLDTRLKQQLVRYQEAVSTAADEQSLIDLTRSFLSSTKVNPLRQNGLVLSVQTRGGTLLSSSDVGRPEEIPQSAEILATGQPLLADVQLGDGEYRIAGAAVKNGTEVLAAVVISASLAEVNETLSSLLLLLVVGGIIGCAVVGVGTWFLLGRALAPVRRITRTAAAISREDLSRRIGYRGPKDEIGELAGTMDGMLDRIEMAFAAQERFISDVSHELRTPLTIVKGHLQVLDRQDEPEAQLAKAEHALVIDELDRMNRLIADLLTLTRAGRGDFLRKERLELDLFLGSLAGQGPHLGEREWKVDELPGGAIEADQDRLTQIFLNLMQNAVAHTTPGQVIALGGSRDRSAGTVSLWVRDEGEGMEDDIARHVFERFYRGKGDTAGGRVGLGLAIAKALVDAHDGSISVESSPGGGARFTTVLPAS